MQTLTVTAPNVYRFVNSFVLTSEDIVTMVEKKERTTATQKWRGVANTNCSRFSGTGRASI